MSDQQTRMTLIQRIQNNTDQYSWEEFNAAYSPYIRAILGRSGIPEALIDDMCQEIFLKIWKSIEQFEYDPEKCRFRTWLCTVCRNTIYSYYRKNTPQQVSLNDVELADKTAEIDNIIELEWKQYIASKAIDNISRHFNGNAIFAYKEFRRGRSVVEIAKEINVAENTVHVYSARVQKAVTREILLLINDLDG